MNIEWKRLDKTTIQKIGWRTIVTKQFELPDGTIHGYATKEAENTHCVATIAIDTDGKVIVAQQYRPGPEKIMVELPGGGVDAKDNKDFEAAARRELVEETGYVAGTMKFLGDVYKDAYTNTVWHFYLATNCVLDANGSQPDEREFIEVLLISIDDLIKAAQNGQTTDVEPLFLAYEDLMALRSAYQNSESDIQ